ncbi:MAG: uroporphyrinogen-III C-methyltransferase [Castellaniella sp.]|nr:uroporphyrinogen-III C-methyltransferase [Castellaniella sp.]
MLSNPKSDGAIPARGPAAPAHDPTLPGRIGHVWLVGAGPGDPDLITLRGLRALQAADVVVHDRLAASELLEHCRPDALRIHVGKRAGLHSMPQEDIQDLLATHALAGRCVVRLKGGDPFIFGRGGEEMAALRAQGIPVTVIPGITAASGCAAATGIPLTHRDLASGVCLMTAHRQDGGEELDWASLAGDRQRTLVFYMGLSQIRRVGTELMLHGLPGSTPAAMISQGTTAAQAALRCSLADLAAGIRDERLASPCLIVIGPVVSLADPDRAFGIGEPAPGRDAPAAPDQALLTTMSAATPPAAHRPEASAHWPQPSGRRAA